MAFDLQDSPPATANAAGRPAIRPVQPDDGPALHALLAAAIPDVMPDRDRWLARWHWQYWANPYRKDRSAGWVLAQGEEILGHLGAVYLPIRVGDVQRTAVVGADYVVAEKIANSGGLFAALELVETLFVGCADCLVMATTANDKTAAVFGRFGCSPIAWTTEFWRAPTSLAQQIRSFCGGHRRLLRKMLNSRVGPLLMRALTSRHRARSRTPAVPLPPGCWLETTVPQLARDMGRLWDDCLATQQNHGGPPQLSVDRSQAYLDWRYAAHPERDKVRVLVMRDADGRPVGAAVVFHETRRDRNVVYVEDVIVLPERRDVLRSLLCAALRIACHYNATHLVTSPGCRAIRDVFWELGFESRARNAPAAVINALPDGPSPLDDHLDFWHGMMF